MRPRPLTRRPLGGPEEIPAEPVDLPALVLNDLIEEYEHDKPRREAEAKILWPREKEKRK